MFSSSQHMTPTLRRRIETLMPHILSKPLMWTSHAASVTTSQNKDEQKDEQLIQELETGKLSTDEAFDRAMDLIEDADYEKARNLIFVTLPYCDNEDAIRRAYRIIGLSYYKNFDFTHALPWFRRASRDSDSTQDWFNLASTAAQMTGQDKLAMHAFEQLETLHKKSSFQLKPSFWNHLYWYVIALVNGKNYALAFTLLNRLKSAYKRARFTDQDYLSEIGLPSFEDFLSICLTLFQRVDRLNQFKDFLQQMREHVDEAGKKTIDQVMQNFDQKIQQNQSDTMDEVSNTFVSS
jgi:tetratricopeptide (TPR) repeat protein